MVVLEILFFNRSPKKTKGHIDVKWPNWQFGGRTSLAGLTFASRLLLIRLDFSNKQALPLKNATISIGTICGAFRN